MGLIRRDREMGVSLPEGRPWVPAPLVPLASAIRRRQRAASDARWASEVDATFAGLEARALSVQELHATIASALRSDEPFVVGRPGGVESLAMAYALQHRFAQHDRAEWTAKLRKDLALQPGVVNRSNEEIDRFALHYLAATVSSDVLVFGRFAPHVIRILPFMERKSLIFAHFHDLEPYTALRAGVEPWTAALAGRKVLVVHPFERSIREQYERRMSVRGVADILPTFELDVVRPPVTFAGEGSPRTWQEELASLTADIAERTFDVAIVGAGGYGLPAAAFIRAMGRRAVHLAGATQLVFGIRGARWDESGAYQDVIDASWVRPHESERPADAGLVEAGCYW
jgi:hypothetical protein